MYERIRKYSNSIKHNSQCLYFKYNKGVWKEDPYSALESFGIIGYPLTINNFFKKSYNLPDDVTYWGNEMSASKQLSSENIKDSTDETRF